MILNKSELNSDHFGEVLNILQEEAAEIIQCASKVKRFGIDNGYNGVYNRPHLEEEISNLKS